jgi:hypothetical protein
MTNSLYEIPEIQDPFETLKTRLIHSDARTYFQNNAQRDYFLHSATRVSEAVDNLDKLEHGLETCCNSGYNLKKSDLLEIMEQYSPQIMEQKTTTKFFKRMPERLGEEEIHSIRELIARQISSYRRTEKKLEEFVENTESLPKQVQGGGLKRTLEYISKCAFKREGEELETDIRTDYKPNDGSIHNWLENLWIDAHNHIVKSWSR